MSVKIGSCSITHSGCRTTVCAADGFEISFSSIGAGIQRVRVPVSGTLRDTVLSFKNPELYTPNSLYAGATLAPTAGRITAGSFSVNGKPHPLAANENGTVNLHGGPENASFAEWEASAPVMTDDGRIRLAYSIQLPDGLCGFPGNRNLTVIYTVGPDHTLLIEYEGVSDRDTYLNLSNHTYFCLSASADHASADHTPAFDHLLEIDADKVILADDAFMPTEIIPVDGTVFDFRKQAPVRQLLATHNNGRPLSASRGYNHAFVLNQKKDRTESPILCFTSPKEDLVLQMYTDAPCAVFYSGGFIDHSYTLSDGSRSGPSCAFAFEMQDYPDASGGHGFPFRITKAGTVWKRWIRWNFLSSQPVTLLS